jgi:hypothetical protein
MPPMLAPIITLFGLSKDCQQADQGRGGVMDVRIANGWFEGLEGGLLMIAIGGKLTKP